MERPTNQDLSTYKKFVDDPRDFDFKLTRHAHERMQERQINLPQVRRVLKTGTLVQVETDIRSGRGKFRIAGRDFDGLELEIVVNLGPGRKVTLITAI